MSLPQYFHCGCCEQFHRVAFDGDCRDDSERFNPEDLDEKHGWDGWEEVELNDLDNTDGDYMTDAEADADVLRMAGMGTDEDYFYFEREWD